MRDHGGTSSRDFGKEGEAAAARYLLKKGFRTTARNVFVGRKEIDLIAVGQGMILFVEVKTRTQTPDSDSPYGRPGDAVNARKRDNLLYAVRGYMYSHKKECEGLQPRIDIVEVYADPSSDGFRALEIRHFPNAVHPRRY
ncbi:MAG: YraN family protein [Clostridia bacterium]|nr:YraN family protein [Clostridia bacterium]